MSYQTTDYIKANLFLLVMERELLTKEAYLKNYLDILQILHEVIRQVLTLLRIGTRQLILVQLIIGQFAHLLLYLKE